IPRRGGGEMFGMPYATEGGWRAGWSGMAARRADLDPAGRSDRKLGRHCTGFGGAAQLHGGAGGKDPGGWDRAEWRKAASPHADLSYVASGCASDCGVLEVVRGCGALMGGT